MKPYLFLIRASNIYVVADFYRLLGLEFTEEKHGDGPVHFSVIVGGIVFEIYPCKEGEAPSNNRLGFELEPNGAEYIKALTYVLSGSPKIHPLGDGKQYCVLIDPDGRYVEIAFNSSGSNKPDFANKRKLTRNELVKFLPEDIDDEEQIQDIIQMIKDMGFEVIED